MFEFRQTAQFLMLVKINYSIIQHYHHLIRTYSIALAVGYCKIQQTVCNEKQKNMH